MERWVYHGEDLNVANQNQIIGVDCEDRTIHHILELGLEFEGGFKLGLGLG